MCEVAAESAAKCSPIELLSGTVEAASSECPAAKNMHISFGFCLPLPPCCVLGGFLYNLVPLLCQFWWLPAGLQL